MADLIRMNEVASKIMEMTLTLQSNFNCRTELKMHKDYFTLKVCFNVNIHGLDVINSICPKADEFYFYAENDCICLNLNFFLED